MSSNSSPPSSIRINTDPSNGYGYRYRQIMRASEALETGSKTETVVAACEHASRDVKAKQEALEVLADHVGDDLLEDIAEVLSTPQLEISVDREIEVGVRE